MSGVIREIRVAWFAAGMSDIFQMGVGCQVCVVYDWAEHQGQARGGTQEVGWG